MEETRSRSVISNLSSKAAVVLLLVAALSVAIVVACPAAGQGQSGTTLSADVDALGHLRRTFHWTIDKSVTPDVWNLFRGDSGTSQYTVSATRDEGTDDVSVDGLICVTNGGDVPTENLLIVAQVQWKAGGGDFQDLTGASKTMVPPHELDAGDTVCFMYEIVFTPVPGAAYRIVARVTITNHSGHIGVPFGPEPRADFILPQTPDTLVDDFIDVDDTNGLTFTFTGSGSATYTVTYICDGDAGRHENAVAIRGSGQSASVSVVVNCFTLDVEKDASTSFKRTYRWAIGKSADQASMTLAAGQSSPVNYQVTLSTITTDGDWRVSGSIWVHNPAPISAEISSVSDVVAGVGAATVNCGVAFPYTMPAGRTLTCSYGVGLPDASSRTNTATATLQNYGYDHIGDAAPEGTTDFTGSADVGFTRASATEIDKCVVVSDTYAGVLGTVCYPFTPSTFRYGRTVGPFGVCGYFTVANTASFTASDTGAHGNASWNVSIRVPCPSCTLTIGYWKNHAGMGPQPDKVSALLPVWLGSSGGSKSIKVTGAAQAVNLLSFKGSDNSFDPSNGVNKLYAQLLGVKLNVRNGVDGAAVSATIQASDLFLATHDSTHWRTLSKPERSSVLTWMGILDNYNNGLIGPGHCSEQSTPPASSTSTLAPPSEQSSVLTNSIPLLAAPVFVLISSAGVHRLFNRTRRWRKGRIRLDMSARRGVWLDMAAGEEDDS